MVVAVLGPGGVGGRAGTGRVDGIVRAGDHVRVGAGQRRVRGRVGARASRRPARPRGEAEDGHVRLYGFDVLRTAKGFRRSTRSSSGRTSSLATLGSCRPLLRLFAPWMRSPTLFARSLIRRSCEGTRTQIGCLWRKQIRHQ